MGTSAPADPPAAPHGSGSSRARWGVAVPVMALAAGLLFGTSAALARTTTFGEEPTDLPGLIAQRTGHVEQLASQADVLRTQIGEAERAGAGSRTGELSERADTMAPVVGAEPVAGPGLRVSLDDAGYSEETLPEGYSVDDVVVHQQDVQGVVNALWAGGAEAMMVQDQRIVSTSAIRCVGNTLYLQGRVYSPPYVITAIGDPERLAATVEQDEIVSTYRAWSDVLGLGYDVERLEEVELPGFTGSVRPEHVVILDEDGAVASTVDEAPASEPAPPVRDELNQR